MVTPGTDAVICNHVSNVFGFVQPVEDIAALCRAREVPLIIDASQSAGMLPLDMTALGAAFVAMPGHKGLYGPQGTGVLLCGKVVPVRHAAGGRHRQPSPSSRRCRTFCRIGWRRGHTICPASPGCWRGSALSASRGLEAICDQERRLTCWRRRACGDSRTSRCLPAGLRGSGGRALHRRRGQDVEAVGRGSGRARDRRPGGASLRTAGPPHRWDAGHRHGPAEFFRTGTRREEVFRFPGKLSREILR